MRGRSLILMSLFVFLTFLVLFPHECQSEGGAVIGRGDTLMIRVWGDDDLTRDVTVSPEGSFRFPLIGEVEAAGRSVEDLRRVITERLVDGYLVDPQVEIVIRAYRSRNVFVLGEVVRPGTYPFDNQTSVIEKGQLDRIFEKAPASGVTFFKNLVGIVGQRWINSYNALLATPR